MDGDAVIREIQWQEAQSNLPLNSIVSWYRNNPVEVQITFLEGKDLVEWKVARSLFIDAVRDGAAGVGDVQMMASVEDDVFVLFLLPPGSEAGFMCKASDVALFLEATYQSVPEADEDLSAAVDTLLSTILGLASEDGGEPDGSEPAAPERKPRRD